MNMLLLCEQLGLFSVHAQGGEQEGLSGPGKRGVRVRKLHFLLLEEQLSSLKKNNDTSKCDSPCQRSLLFVTVQIQMLDFRQL